MITIEIHKADGSPAYEIRANGDGLYYLIYKWCRIKSHKTGEVRDDFKSMGVYPDSLE